MPREIDSILGMRLIRVSNINNVYRNLSYPVLSWREELKRGGGRGGKGKGRRYRVSLMEAWAHRFPPDVVVFCNTHIFPDSWYESTRCWERGCGTEVSKVFATLSQPDPWFKAHGPNEENNPATVRWIDTTRTYVDM